MKKKISTILAISFLVSTFPFSACSVMPQGFRENVLRVASWDEYIDMGGEDSYYYDANTNPEVKPIYEEFEEWYFENTGKRITVEYIPLQDNETMYNQIKMGDKYDLLCPSEYMAQKLKDEGYLQAFPEEFFLPTDGNYYAQNVSKYTSESFIAEANLTGYMAGYMWGTTGFVYNPYEIGNSPEESREIMKSWHCLTSEECKRKITAKDNARDSYFMGLGLYHEEELLALKARLESGELELTEYKTLLQHKMNDTSSETLNGVRPLLSKARKNLYGLETDEGKMNLVTRRTNAAYQWSGDAVYILDEAEEADPDLKLEYSIPEAASNIWFDGWVMMNGANTDLATAFVNYISMPENAVRNMYYIGYTSCLGGQEIYDYIAETYEAEESEKNVVSYDLSYFFGEGYVPLIVPEEQTRRQLFAQYPLYETTHRLVVMKYFPADVNERVNRMWNNIK